MTVNDLIKQLQAISEEDRELTWYVTSSTWSGEAIGFDGPVPDSVLVWDR